MTTLLGRSSFLRQGLFYRGRTALLAVVWSVLLASVALPALVTFSSSLEAEGQWSLASYRQFFTLRQNATLDALVSDWSFWEGSRLFSPGLQALYGSLSISVASVLVAALIGIPLAFFVERNSFPGRGPLSALLLMPLTLPPIVGVVSFDLIFSEAGILPRLLANLLRFDSPPLFLEGKGGIVAVHGYSFFPFFFLLVSNAVRELDSSLVEASRSMGCGRLATLVRVELPMLTPALFGAALMVFMSSMASFSAPLLFDVDGMYLSTHIYNLKTQNLWDEATTATVIFTLSSLASLLLLRFLRGNRKFQPVGKGVPRKRHEISSPLGRAAALGVSVAVVVLALLPHLGILLWSFTRDGSWTHQLLPPSYTLENYRRILGAGAAEVLEPVRNSFWMAGVATLANALFGVAAAYVLKARGVRGKTLSEVMVMLPWALPGTVIAINLILALSHPTPLLLGASLANSVWLLPIAYFIRNIPLVTRPVLAAWERWGEDLEEAARSLGSGRLRAFGTVSLPLIFPAVVAGAMLAFVTALGEFIASAVLFTPRNKPISMAIYGEFHAGAYGLCSAYGVLLILLIATVMVVGGKRIRL